MTIETSSLGKESFRIRVRAVGYDPSTGTIDFAFPATDAAPAVWTAGAWSVAGELGTGGVYTATAQTPTVGETSAGATVDLAPGAYDVWAKVTTPGETIVRKVDDILVT